MSSEGVGDDWVSIEMAFTLLGGLGLFIYGMKLMGEGLERSAGERLKHWLEVLTKNPVRGVVLGALVTAIVQSSSATTVMVVGLVNAGLMSLMQAVGVIMGANIGTTVTAQLIAFKLTRVALPAIGIGTALYLFAGRKNLKFVGQVLLGFGLLFYGMQVMEVAVKPLAKSQGLVQFIASFSTNPLLGVIVGFLTTGIIQSSSATIGILQALAGEGIVSISAALPILCGDNIGTCVTALISSIGANLTARRAAMIHLMFNVIGTVIFLTFLPLFKPFVLWTSQDPMRQIANAHTFFNLINTVVQLPFAAILVTLATTLVPGQAEVVEKGVKYIDDRLLESPSIALSQARKEVGRMGQLALENLRSAMKLVIRFNEREGPTLRQKEAAINELARETSRFLGLLFQKPLLPAQANQVADMINAINDMERVGDHDLNLLELAEYREENGLPFSNQAVRDLSEMAALVEQSFADAVRAFTELNYELANKVIEREDLIDEMDRRLRDDHIKRLNEGTCNPNSGVVFLGVISNLERIGDHAFNLASYLVKKDRHYKRLQVK
jgi:phosphate:Na+ symporter